MRARVQRSSSDGSAGGPDRSVPAPGKRPLTANIQRKPSSAAGEDDGVVHDLATAGTAGVGGELPFLDRIQASFGTHDVSSVQAHTDRNAAVAASGMGATAFATGNHVAFGVAPDLHTAAHEAAHVVQQRAGVHLKGGVGQEGDPYEQHADAVGDAVVRGDSAQGLLDSLIGPAPSQHRGAASSVQRKPDPPVGGESEAFTRVRVLVTRLANQAHVQSTDFEHTEDSKALTGRSANILTSMFLELAGNAEDFKALTPVERIQLVPKVTFLVERSARLALGDPGLQGLYRNLRTFAESIVGMKVDVHLLAQKDRDSSPEERLEVVRAALDEAGPLVHAAATSDAPSSSLAAPLARLATCKQLLSRGPIGTGQPDDDVAQRQALRPVLESLTADADVLASKHPGDPRIDELFVRLSDVRQKVGLPRLTSESMKSMVGEILKHEKDARLARAAMKPTFTDDQAVRFDAAAAKWKLALARQFTIQKDAVSECWEEAEVSDAPKKASLWETLALAALKAATGGIAGLITGAMADSVFGADPDGEETNGWKDAYKDSLTWVSKKLIETAFDKVKDHKGSTKGGGKGGDAANGGGGASSTDPKTAFFASQVGALTHAHYAAEDTSLDTTTSLRQGAAFASQPEAVIALLQRLTATVPAVEGDIANIQRMHTRAKFLTFLVGDTTLADEAALEHPGVGEVTFDHNVAGMLSMKLEVGNPGDAVRVVEAWMKGVNKPIRDQVLHMNPTKLGIPMRARFLVPSPTNATYASVVSDQGYHAGDSMEAHIPIGDSIGTSLLSDQHDHGDNWLVKAGGGAVEEPDDKMRDHARANAARRILDEDVGRKPLAQQGIDEIEG